MNTESVGLVAQAFADYLNAQADGQSVAVGFDGRIYSPVFARQFASVLSGNHIKVVLSDAVVPTPILSYVVYAKKLDAGVMITASHNPPEYNGVKFKARYGGPFLTEETKRVEQLVGRTTIRWSDSGFDVQSMLPEYLRHVQQFIDFKSITKAGLSVLVDSMGGAGGMILEMLLAQHGCRVRTLDGIPDSQFHGRSPEPIEKNLRPLIEELHADPSIAVGVGTDGDADRVGVVMDGGRWLSAQETILLLTDHIVNMRKAPGNIVKTSSVTDKMRLHFERNGRKVYDVQVGFKYICEKMIAEPIAIGCEESGGYGYAGHIPERDGILSALLLLEMMAKNRVTRLSDLVGAKRKAFGEIFYDRLDILYDGSDRVEILPGVALRPPDSIGSIKIRAVNTFLSSRGIVNGVKFILDGDCRWLLLRASETEPAVRIYAEGTSNAEVQSLLQFGTSLFRIQS